MITIFSLRAVLTSMVMFLCLIADSANARADNTAMAQEAEFRGGFGRPDYRSLTEKEIDKTERRNHSGIC